MSTKKKLLEAAAGAAGGVTYVDDVFSTYLYDGNSSTQTITNGIDLAGEGGLVWQKGRSTGVAHYLWDTERGSTKRLSTNATGAQVTTDSSWISSFNSDGFSIGNSGSFNTSGQNYASWTFRKQPGFFDIVTYTGDGTNNRQISHNLGSTPGMIIIKKTSASGSWYCWHRNYTGAGLYLENATVFSGDTPGFNTSQSSTTINLSSNSTGSTNSSGATYVAYLFAHDAQDFGEDSDEAIIKCGTYTGNGSSTGPVINLGFEPQWVMIKSTGSNPWMLFDSMRGIVTDNTDWYLMANDISVENGFQFLNLTPTGFQLNSTGSYVNTSGQNYIYVAIRRPHKPASELAATDLFKPVVKNFTAGLIETGFPVDLNVNFGTSADDYNRFTSRLTGKKSLYSDRTVAEGTENYWDFAENEGMGVTYSGNVSGYSNLCFKRAPGFFDVVAYTGTGSPNNGYRDVTHNLGVVPEMIWQKRRDSTSEWVVNHIDGGMGYLNLTNAFDDYPVSGNNHADAFTATTFSNKASNEWNFNVSGATYIAYLFASVDGISKAGSYTGTGNDLNVDCGFSAGARFVLIKRTDSTGDWYFWDTARGIVAGNDPYHRFNVGYPNGQDVTNTDYIDPLSSGFTITSTAPAALNASGGNYIFYAIA